MSQSNSDPRWNGGPLARVLLPWMTARAAERERFLEAQALSELILARHGSPGPEHEVFVRERVFRRLNWYGARGRLTATLHGLVALAIIAAGLTSSGIAALSAEFPLSKMTVMVLGVLVGVLTGVIQVWKPTQRAGNYYWAENELRNEGWRYVHSRGQYEGNLTPETAWACFVDAVLDIEQRATTADRLEAQTSAA